MPRRETPQRRGGHAETVESSRTERLKQVPRRRRADGANRATGASRSAAGRVLYSSFEQVPGHLKDIRFILNGYRANYDFKTALMSALRLHNETGNIWSHLIGFLIFALLTWVTIVKSPSPLSIGGDFVRAVESKWNSSSLGVSENLHDVVSKAAAWEERLVQYGGEKLHALEDVLDVLKSITIDNIHDLAGLSANFSSLRMINQEELRHLESIVYESLTSLVDVTWPVHRWPLHVFTTGAMICLFTSSMCHLFGCCSKHVAMLMWQFDYAGIAVLIVASFVPPVYYGFLCRPIYAVTYLGMVTVFGIATIAVTLMPRFQDANYHAFRASVFTSLGLFGIIPTIHLARIHREVGHVHEALVLDFWMGAIYLIGTGIYTLKIPERFWPGRFDVAFHSHQLFHVSIVIAATIHYRACEKMIAWRDSTGFCFMEGGIGDGAWSPS